MTDDDIADHILQLLSKMADPSVAVDRVMDNYCFFCGRSQQKN
jgi:hypothetical protein